MAVSTNDNDMSHILDARPDPDAHGQAAMRLIESLIHGLIARSVIDVADALKVVGIAAEVTTEMAAIGDDAPASAHASLRLLTAIERRIGHDS